MTERRPTARDYYYTVIAPEEQFRSYQWNHQRTHWLSLADRSAARRVLEYPTDVSNDPLLGAYVRQLAKQVSEPLRTRLAGVFVAKRRDYSANAFAPGNRSGYEGDLVFFHVGLSDACYQYSILFAQMVRITDALVRERSRGDGLPSLEKLKQDILRLAEAQRRWRLMDDLIALDQADVLDASEADEPVSAGVAGTTDEFILYHELAHHLLGHTGSKDDASDYLRLLPQEVSGWPGLPGSHIKELHCDALALLFQAGALKARAAPINEKRSARATLGSLLTMTVLGQAVGDPTSSSSTHPSVLQRFRQCAALVDSLFQDVGAREARRDIRNFQKLLARTQGRGLATVAVV